MAFVCRRTNSKQTSTSSQNECRAVYPGGRGSGGHVEEGCCSKSQVSERPIFKKSFPRRRERRGKQTSHEFEEPDELLTLPSFQNGGSPNPEGNAPEERLSVQGGLGRCLFLPSTTSGSQKICSVPMEGQHLPISSPLFWLGPSSKTV